MLTLEVLTLYLQIKQALPLKGLMSEFFKIFFFRERHAYIYIMLEVSNTLMLLGHEQTTIK